MLERDDGVTTGPSRSHHPLTGYGITVVAPRRARKAFSTDFARAGGGGLPYLTMILNFRLGHYEPLLSFTIPPIFPRASGLAGRRDGAVAGVGRVHRADRADAVVVRGA